MNIDIHLDAANLRAGLEKGPDILHRHIDGGLSVGAAIIAAEAKNRAPKSLSNLVNSIIYAAEGNLRWVVRAGSRHAAYVEHGTGPAVGKKRYYPNPDSLLQYLMTNAKPRGFKRWSRSTKPGKDRGSQELDIWFRSRAFAWWIYQHGTRAQPFMQPAAEAKRDSCVAAVKASVDAGLREIFQS